MPPEIIRRPDSKTAANPVVQVLRTLAKSRDLLVRRWARQLLRPGERAKANNRGNRVN
jgi:hypothetical protein